MGEEQDWWDLPGSLPCPRSGLCPLSPQTSQPLAHPHAVGRAEGRMRFFCVLSSLTEQVLVLRLWGVECLGEPFLTHTDAVDTQVRHAAEPGSAQHRGGVCPGRTSHRSLLGRCPGRPRHPESPLVCRPLSVTVRNLGTRERPPSVCRALLVAKVTEGKSSGARNPEAWSPRTLG